jgi:hypothetical protein
LDRITWKNNSCWLDTMMLALFGIGNAPPVLRFLGGGVAEAALPQFRVQYDEANFRIEKQCTPAQMQQFYDLLVADIVQLHSPATKQCPLGIRQLWNTCALRKVREGREGEPIMVLESLRDAFPVLQEYWLVTEQNVGDFVPMFVEQTNVNAALVFDTRPQVRGKEMCAYQTAWSTEYRFVGNGSVTYTISNNHNGYYLGAIIMTSGGHFTTFVRDRARNQWIYINVRVSGKNYVHAYSVLPAHAYTIMPAEEKPIMYIYFPL